MTAALTAADGSLCRDNFFSSAKQYLTNQGRQGQENPFERHPIPAEQQPPYDAMMFLFFLDVINDIDGYIFAAAIRTFHMLYLLSEATPLLITNIADVSS